MPPPSTQRTPLLSQFIDEPDGIGTLGHGRLVSPTPNTGVKYGATRIPCVLVTIDSATGRPMPSVTAFSFSGFSCAYPRSPLTATVSSDPFPATSPASATRISAPSPSSSAGEQLVQSAFSTPAVTMTLL